MRNRPPAWAVAPDLYSLILRDWIEALELKMLAYRHMEFARG